MWKSNEHEGYYVCRSNKRFGNQVCSRHYIRSSILVNALLEHIRYLHSLAKKSPNLLYSLIFDKQELQLVTLRNSIVAEINVILEQLENLTTVEKKLYSDYALGKITEDKYDMLEKSLKVDQDTLKQELTEKQNFKNKLAPFDAEKIDTFIHVLLSFENIDEFTFELATYLIDYLEIYDPIIQNNVKCQAVKIHYHHIGCFEQTNIVIKK